MPLAMAAMFFRTSIGLFSVYRNCHSDVVDDPSLRTAIGAAYPLLVANENPEQERPYAGLCADCRHMRRMRSDRGSTFYLCAKSATDPAFPKYPRLPVLQCPGYEQIGREGKEKTTE
jgi:hypothetical protein